MNCVIIIPAKLCNQRQFFSHDAELNNKDLLHYILHLVMVKLGLGLKENTTPDKEQCSIGRLNPVATLNLESGTREEDRNN